MRKRQRAVLLLQPTITAERQERAVLPWAEEHRLRIVSMTSDPWSALALVSGKFAEAVVVTFATAETDGFGQMVASAGGRLEAVHQDRGRRTQRVARDALGALRQDVADALGRGATTAMIALVLGLTEDQVEAATRPLVDACTEPVDRHRRPEPAESRRDRRTERVERPQARHPVPLRDPEPGSGQRRRARIR